jgi:hypothetical protein
MDDLRTREIAGKINAIIPENHATKSKEREAILSVRYGSYDVRKPSYLRSNKKIAKTSKLNLVSVTEENAPEGAEAVEWILMTNLEMDTLEDAIRAVECYRQRWKIERFHYVLKSGCEIEKIQQRSVDGIEIVLLMYSIIAIHIMMLTYTARNAPDTPCSIIFSEGEWKTLYCAANLTREAPDEPYSVALAVRFVAKLGGFSGAPSDDPPGLKVIWLGLNKLFLLNYYRHFL